MDKKNIGFLLSLCDILPENCADFILETGTELATSTRLMYARELNTFFHYLLFDNNKFMVKKLKEITLDNIRTITSQDISRYLTYLNDNQLAEKTIARRRATLSRFFNYLVANRKIPFNPVDAAVKVKIHKSDRLIYLDTKEQNSFITEVIDGKNLSERRQMFHERYKLRDLAIVLLFLDTGIRVSELCGINIGDFDFENNSVIVLRKGGNIQTVYFSDDTKEVLKNYHDARMSKFQSSTLEDAFFVSLKAVRLSVRAIQLLVKKYAISTLPGKGQKITPHKLRSSFAMTFYGETSDLLALKTKLNHSSFSVIDVYTKATDKQMYEYRNTTSEARVSESEENSLE